MHEKKAVRVERSTVPRVRMNKPSLAGVILRINLHFDR